jgi:large subunit ribosomal protein L23
MTDARDILLKPVLTEKATSLAERHNHVSFKVHPEANKHQIRAAIEASYPVKVLKVRTLISPGKKRRKGNSIGRRPATKKAIVTLKEGDSIDFYRAE